MRPSDFDIQEIIDCCQGTCTETIQSALDFYYPEMKEDELTKDDLNQINNQIFLCPVCGWWCEISQASESEKEGDTVCEDCDEEGSLE